MASTDRMDQPVEVANKVLRRAQVSKMTRTLQNRLALANVKIKHGWESLSLDTLEPRVDVELKRKRPGSSNETMSDASSISERFLPTALVDSSPLAAPIFSDEIQRSGSRGSRGSRAGSTHSQTKRPRYTQPYTNYPGSSNHARTKVRTSTSSSASWKSMHRLPESSPVYPRRHARFGTTHAPSLSFVSETSTVPDDPRSPLLSEEDDEDLPITSFQFNRSHIHSSPPRAPRTPPPAVARSARLRQSGFTAAAAARDGAGEDDANLLMYLATSPSPARQGSSKSRMLAPSTPPMKSTPLPSSMMSTPRGGDAPFPGFGLSTPSANINFADFLNMSPSPAQVGTSWNRTPVAGKTPAAAREARRRLNFDTMLPQSNDSMRMPKVEGLGMELGGELVS
ncbi:hypothetical protein B0J11DRAFT_2289 [Dendryphion nanum]|uniref:Uncharacterized protein n=1 Tax=Dendryphion nanum TaxID=256645 RepID=A0A9P9EJ24_9PLEO|nr:hypothetical protein B0J11DRAFT_2289 [Dendryphion nanum]